MGIEKGDEEGIEDGEEDGRRAAGEEGMGRVMGETIISPFESFFMWEVVWLNCRGVGVREGGCDDGLLLLTPWEELFMGGEALPA